MLLVLGPELQLVDMVDDFAQVVARLNLVLDILFHRVLAPKVSKAMLSDVNAGPEDCGTRSGVRAFGTSVRWVSEFISVNSVLLDPHPGIFVKVAFSLL
jgi:hypothetical protein